MSVALSKHQHQQPPTKRIFSPVGVGTQNKQANKNWEKEPPTASICLVGFSRPGGLWSPITMQVH